MFLKNRCRFPIEAYAKDKWHKYHQKEADQHPGVMHLIPQMTLYRKKLKWHYSFNFINSLLIFSGDNATYPASFTNF